MKMTGFDKLGLLALAAIVPCAWLGCNDTPKTDSATTTQSQAVTTTPSATPATSAATPMTAPAGSGGPGGGDHGGAGRAAMMQAGVDACNGKASGDACTMTDGSHTMTGTCAAPPAGATDTKLSCRPAGGPGGPGGGDHGGGRPH